MHLFTWMKEDRGDGRVKVSDVIVVVYYEWMKRDLKRRHGCRCHERLEDKTEGSTFNMTRIKERK